MDVKRYAPAALPRQRNPMFTAEEFGLASGRYDWLRKISPAPNFEPPTVQPVAVLYEYTVWTTCNVYSGTFSQECEVEPCDVVYNTGANLSLYLLT